MLKKLYNRCVDSGYYSVFIVYAIIVILFAAVFIFVFHKDPVFFLTDDGYYVVGKLFYEGKYTLLHQSRGPGLYLLFSTFNIFPDIVHPYLRILVTLAVTFGNLYF
ncbi:MAG: hypothetical protein LWX07_08810, partial [Bacteroidetes bacterium]|nr:hypothetical protein [Bacteroidota bacterium]